MSYSYVYDINSLVESLAVIGSDGPSGVEDRNDLVSFAGSGKWLVRRAGVSGCKPVTLDYRDVPECPPGPTKVTMRWLRVVANRPPNWAGMEQLYTPRTPSDLTAISSPAIPTTLPPWQQHSVRPLRPYTPGH